ncbi:AMP-binding protein [Gordonia sihwensis]|uniref:AMP-binding protein n=1 Tax=Gordonia sihwensis TaxID=173559 RepID=UPI0005F00CC0|nr:AMP-binding protein [Gordonia sihwensis]KJR05602.1 acyl-CoA synthetase [Gordonia sihwensis]
MIDDGSDLPRPTSGLTMFHEAVAAGSGRPLIRYFDGVLTMRDVDRHSDALAHHLIGQGFSSGDRLAILTQNSPAFVIALVAAWKAGGIAVPLNPMNTRRETAFALVDTGARALVCLDELYAAGAQAVIADGDTDVRTVVLTSIGDWAAKTDPAPGSLSALPWSGPVRGADPGRDDPALLLYTSGTTGVPKAAVVTHGNLTAGAELFRRWTTIGSDDEILGITPLFHVTGIVGHVALALRVGAPLILAHRFDPPVLVRALREHRPAFVIGVISAIVALADEADGPDDFRSVKWLATGGAPVSADTAARVAERTGTELSIVYGLTETTSPAIATPVGRLGPIDRESGALSIGMPVAATRCRILDDSGEPVGPGVIGEVEIAGPQVSPGYWQDGSIVGGPGDGALRTGDIGFRDTDGWVFLIDRRKDMITTAGYKVWPREVEEVLYRHPAIAEAAVVGVPDDTRGEVVSAFIAFESGATATVTDIEEFAAAQLAAYKRPRSITVLPALPKTATGKVLRRRLRG